MRRLAAVGTGALVGLVQCGGYTSILQPDETPCTGACIASFPTTQILAVVPGDTVRLAGRATNADGQNVAVRWLRTDTNENFPVTVDSATGVAVAQRLGPGRVHAFTIAENPTRSEPVQIFVSDPDSSASPYIAATWDAGTGALLYRNFVGHDSIDVDISYVLGRASVTAGAPTVRLELRAAGVTGGDTAISAPATVRGRGAIARVRINLSARRPDGSRRFNQSVYEFYVILPLADGRRLGSGTGYEIKLPK